MKKHFLPSAARFCTALLASCAVLLLCTGASGDFRAFADTRALASESDMRVPTLTNSDSPAPLIVRAKEADGTPDDAEPCPQAARELAAPQKTARACRSGTCTPLHKFRSALIRTQTVI